MTPLLFTAPWRRAPAALLRSPGLGAAAVGIGLVIGMVSAAPVLYVSAVGAGVVQAEYASVCPTATGLTLSARPAQVTPDGVVPADPVGLLVAAVGDSGVFAAPEVVRAAYSPTPVTAGDREARIGFLARDGWRDNTELVGDEAAGDVWLPDTLAADLAVGPGDTIVVATTGGDVGLVVAGVFRDLATRPLNEFWCAANDGIMPRNMFGEIFPPPMAIVEPTTYDERDLRTSLNLERTVATLARPPRTVDDADRAAAAFVASTARLDESGAQASISSGVERLARRAHLVRDAVASTTLPVAALAVLCALAASVVFGNLWVRGRRSTCIALSSASVAPWALGVKAALEALVPFVVGGAAGSAIARWGVGVWAPSSVVEPGTTLVAAAVAAGAALVGLCLAGTAAAVAARAVLRSSAPRRRRRVPMPIEPVLALAAWWSARRIGTQELVPLDGREVAATNAWVLVLPLSLLALGAAMSGRLWRLLTRRRRPTLARPSPFRLAVRRLQHGARTGSALLAVGTLALGVCVFGLAMNSSLSRTSLAKSSVFVGSDLRVLVAGALSSPIDGATEVWIREELDFDGEAVDVIAVDPATFADVAFWDTAFADRSLDSLMAGLGAEAADGRVPAIAVGRVGSDGAVGAVTNPEVPGEPLDVTVVGVADVFPGAGNGRPALVVPLAAAAVSDLRFFHFVWAEGDYSYWRPVLQDAGAKPMLAVSRQDAVDASLLSYAAWSFDFVRALGVFVGLLVVAALVLQIAVRRRQQALAAMFLGRMSFGVGQQRRALLLELGALVAATAVLGTALALVSVRIVAPHVDPLAILPPSPLVVVPWRGLLVVSGATFALALVGGVVAEAMGRRTDVVEVLRDA